jgi:Pectate lyase superfamily protein/Right handed beta helix region
MPEYTENLGLYKPNRADNLDVDTTLAENFEAIDQKIGSALKDDSGRTYASLQERLADISSGDSGVVPSTGFIVATNESNVKGDGKNNDTAGIQAILDKAKGNANIEVYFPAGTYKITTALFIYEGTTIRAHEKAIFKREHDGNIFQNTPTGDMNSTGYNGNGNIRIEGGTLDMQGDIYGNGTAIAFGHSHDVVFKGITIKDVTIGHAMEINSSRDVLVTECRFLGYDKADTQRIYAEAVQLDLAKSSGVLPWFGSYDHTPCKNIIMTKNFCGASEKMGPWGRFTGSHAGTIKRWHENVVVTDNIIHDCLDYAVETYSWNNVVISGNVIVNCNGGVALRTILQDSSFNTTDPDGNQTNKSQRARNFVVNNNVFKGGGSIGPAISVNGQETGLIENVTITGNVVEDRSNSALYIAYAHNVNVNGNTFTDIRATAISTRFNQSVSITNNYMRKVTGNGVTFYGTCNYISISGNVLKEVSGHGVSVDTNCYMVKINDNEFAWVGASGQSKNQIQLINGVNRFSVSNNVHGNFSSEGYLALNGVFIDSGAQNGIVSGNMLIGLSLSDSGTNISKYSNAL